MVSFHFSLSREWTSSINVFTKLPCITLWPYIYNFFFPISLLKTFFTTLGLSTCWKANIGQLAHFWTEVKDLKFPSCQSYINYVKNEINTAVFWYFKPTITLGLSSAFFLSVPCWYLPQYWELLWTPQMTYCIKHPGYSLLLSLVAHLFDRTYISLQVISVSAHTAGSCCDLFVILRGTFFQRFVPKV